jgi:dipeptidase
VIAFFRQTYEGTRFELSRNLVVASSDNGDEPARSPWANPWMDRGEQALFNALKPDTVEFHRPIPVMYNAYNTVIQCRSWLPDPIGGVCWFGFDNPATTPRAPLFCGITRLPDDYAIDNQHRFRRDSAAWAFRRASRLACIKWGANESDVRQRIDRWEDKAAAELPSVEQRALELWADEPDRAREVLTQYATDFCRAMTHEYWQFGDELWMQYRFRM